MCVRLSAIPPWRRQPGDTDRRSLCPRTYFDRLLGSRRESRCHENKYPQRNYEIRKWLFFLGAKCLHSSEQTLLLYIGKILQKKEHKNGFPNSSDFYKTH